MILDADELDVEHIYKLLIATIVPRAIGWVSTLSTDGVANIAPFSFFTGWCSRGVVDNEIISTISIS